MHCYYCRDKTYSGNCKWITKSMKIALSEKLMIDLNFCMYLQIFCCCFFKVIVPLCYFGYPGTHYVYHVDLKLEENCITLPLK